jgi:hypothetical protein
LRQTAHPLPAPIALDVPFARGAKEFIRATVAFALFLVLLAPASASGFDQLYAEAVVAAARAIVVSTQHFPLLARLDNPSLHNLQFGVILTFALFLVSTNLNLISRIKRFGLALAVMFSFHVIVAILTIRVWVTQDFLNRMNILVLSPAEFRVLDWLRYFSYDVGLEIAAFVMLVLTVIWNLTASRQLPPVPENRLGRGRTRQRRRSDERDRGGGRHLAVAAIGLGVIAILSSAAVLYGKSRETDPRHVEAHAKIGHLFWNSHNDALAEEQYRLALAGGTADPEVFYNLAGLETRSGNRDAALRLLGQGVRVAHTHVWRSRFQKATVLIQSKSASP